MKKILFIFIITFFSSVSTNAQKIEMKKVFGGYTFSQEGKFINHNQIQEIVKNNKEALDLVNSAKSNQNWGVILGTAGGALVGFPIGTAIGGGDPEWALAGAGAALILVAIPIVNGYNKKMKSAIDIYNAEQVSFQSKFQPSFAVNFKGTGIGISMSF